MQIASLDRYRLPHYSCYGLLPPIRRLGHLPSYFITSKLPILQSAKANANESLEDKVKVLKQKMELLEINCDDSCVPGYFSHVFCPKCKGGKSIRSLSLHIIQNVDVAMWRCYHTSCGWAGQVFADERATNEGINESFKVVSSTPMPAETIVLEPLGEQLIAYFADRMISEETLNRNAVMQIADGDKDTIAFNYIENGMNVGCKYRTMDKRFWQDKGTWKWLYGLDDIKEASEIIIVEGEIDKLSVEEAGFRNCVSVPGGAPQCVSSKKLPALQNDKAYPYLWNSKEYLDKISRIVLATDGDIPGQALAEELARRLGKERCWVVRWPKRDESSYCKDANEVLKYLGPKALKQVIETAELYNPQNTNI